MKDLLLKEKEILQSAIDERVKVANAMKDELKAHTMLLKQDNNKLKEINAALEELEPKESSVETLEQMDSTNDDKA